jgi:hypothetical protein
MMTQKHSQPSQPKKLTIHLTGTNHHNHHPQINLRTKISTLTHNTNPTTKDTLHSITSHTTTRHTQTKSNTPILTRIVMQGDDPRTLRRITDNPSIVDWANETVGDTRGKVKKRQLQGQRKKQKRVHGSDESTLSLGAGRCPSYQESNDNTSATNDDDGGDGEARGSGYYIAPSGGGTRFTGVNHALCYICLLQLSI